MIEDVTLRVIGKIEETDAGKKRFTVTDTEGREIICFNPRLRDQLEIGKIIQLDLEPSKFESGKPMLKKVGGEEEKPAEKQYRGRDEDKVDLRTFVMEVGADRRAGLEDPNSSLSLARKVWLITVSKTKEEKVEAPMAKPPIKGMDKEWLKSSLKTLGWTNKQTAEYLADTYEMDGSGSLGEVLARLDNAQENMFVKYIEAQLSTAKEVEG